MADEIFLLDTNILSASSKQKQHPIIKAWLAGQERLAVPYPAILEVEVGIVERLRVDQPGGRRLRRWFNEIVVETQFEYAVPTHDVAKKLAEMMCQRELAHLWMSNSIKRKPGQDLFVAATSIAYGYPIATCDRFDFELIDRYFPLPGVYDPKNETWIVPRRVFAPSPPLSSTLIVAASGHSILKKLEGPRDVPYPQEQPRKRLLCP